MRAVVQRASYGRVSVEGEVTGEIGNGLVVLLGVGQGDGAKDVEMMADKLVNLRVFLDDEGKMNRSLLDVGGDLLLISQFTLLGDCRKGRRPSFIDAAAPEEARRLYEEVATAIRRQGVRVGTGVFGAMMKVELANEGPVTLLLDTTRTF
ncbi:MAG TPA: D-aminoacyl-tRNA deacylase [Armatimonadota bacterium]|jgi:D-tyrosyl-tRNA(Tyr) deacylase